MDDLDGQPNVRIWKRWIDEAQALLLVRMFDQYGRMDFTVMIAEALSLGAQIATAAADRSPNGLGSQTDEEVLGALRDFEELGRFVDTARVHAAAIVEERSDFGGLQDGLAFKYGHSRAVHLVEHVTRASQADIYRRIRLGKNIRSTTSMTGEPLPPKFSKVADAMEAGDISIPVAEAIIRGLDQARKNHVNGDNEQPGEFEENVAAAEEALVDEATREPVDYVNVQVKAWRDALDPDGAPMRDEDIMARRGLRRGRERNGVVRWEWHTTGVTTAMLDGVFADAARARTPRFVPVQPNPFDPDGVTLATPEETAALLSDDTLDGLDGDQVPHTATGGVDCEEVAAVLDVKDTRTRQQRDSDVLDGVLRAGLLASENEMGGTKPIVEVMVVATLADLEAGRGVGWIDGLEESVSIDYVKELGCSSGYRLVVQGDEGEILWLGKEPRKFTEAQKRAVIVRDGPTCAIDGCAKPSRQTDVHHVTFHSKGGPTDVDNAVLLCPEHHHMIHKSPFRIEMHNGKPMLLAPRWLNPNETWKPMGHARHRNRPQVHERPEWSTTLDTSD